MGKVTRFEDLDCWQAARELVKMIFVETKTGEISRDFDTRSQIRRASVSVMNNIAEGFGRMSDKEFIRFLEIAASSANEVKSMLYLLEDLQYLPLEKIKILSAQVDKARNFTLGLIRYLVNKNKI
jgi:four helix bundle protein